MLHVFLHVCNVAEENRCLTRVSVLKDRRQATDCKTGMHMCIECQMMQPSFSLMCYTDRKYNVPIVSVHYTVYCIATVLLNYTISGKIGINVVT